MDHPPSPAKLAVREAVRRMLDLEAHRCVVSADEMDVGL
jgi:hypothetical protein